MKVLHRRDIEDMVEGLGLEEIPQEIKVEANSPICCPQSKGPLNLPEGSVRAAITLVIILSGCIATVIWKDVPGALGVAFGTVITSYFNVRGGSAK